MMIKGILLYHNAPLQGHLGGGDFGLVFHPEDTYGDICEINYIGLIESVNKKLTRLEDLCFDAGYDSLDIRHTYWFEGVLYYMENASRGKRELVERINDIILAVDREARDA